MGKTREPQGRAGAARASAGLALACLVPAVVAATCACAPAAAAAPEPGPIETASAPGESLIGKPVPDWGELRFLDPPDHRTPGDFRGRVTLVRFWTSNCPRCRASAVTLRDWTRLYRHLGLVVIGVYLPKTRGEVTSDADVRKFAKDIGLDAVLAVDPDWDALGLLWKHGGHRHTVSVSLLVDREGIVRAVHGGGRMSYDAPPDQRSEFEAFSRVLEREFTSI